ncbi:hypothetical protein [Brytella acorum]|nr:hypothetical protein [Brytella acorum]MDF3625813.1 hypothetical protein [Brytella acorum]
MSLLDVFSLGSVALVAVGFLAARDAARLVLRPIPVRSRRRPRD